MTSSPSSIPPSTLLAILTYQAIPPSTLLSILTYQATHECASYRLVCKQWYHVWKQFISRLPNSWLACGYLADHTYLAPHPFKFSRKVVGSGISVWNPNNLFPVEENKKKTSKKQLSFIYQKCCDVYAEFANVEDEVFVIICGRRDNNLLMFDNTGTLTKTLNITDSDDFQHITNFFIFKGKVYFYAYLGDTWVWHQGYITGQELDIAPLLDEDEGILDTEKLHPTVALLCSSILKQQQKIDISDEKLISNLRRKNCFEWRHNAGYALYPQSPRLIFVHQINFSDPNFSAFVFFDFKDSRSPRITVCANLNRYNIIHAVFGMEDNLYVLAKDGILRFEVNAMPEVQHEVNFMRFPVEFYGFTGITKIYDFILVYGMQGIVVIPKNFKGSGEYSEAASMHSYRQRLARFTKNLEGSKEEDVNAKGDTDTKSSIY